MQYELKDPESYEFLRMSDCVTVPGINDKKEYEDTLKSIEILVSKKMREKQSQELV